MRIGRKNIDEKIQTNLRARKTYDKSNCYRFNEKKKKRKRNVNRSSFSY